MSFKHRVSIPFVLAGALAAGATYIAFESLLTAGALGLLAFLAITWAATAAGKGRSTGLHDPAISTLVFPPESRFEQSVLPKR